jgi:hypothetical protein
LVGSPAGFERHVKEPERKNEIGWIGRAGGTSARPT